MEVVCLGDQTPCSLHPGMVSGDPVEEARVCNLFHTCGPLPPWSQYSAHSKQRVTYPILCIHAEHRVSWQEPSKVYPEQGVPCAGMCSSQPWTCGQRIQQSHTADSTGSLCSSGSQDPVPTQPSSSAPLPRATAYNSSLGLGLP